MNKKSLHGMDLILSKCTMSVLIELTRMWHQDQPASWSRWRHICDRHWGQTDRHRVPQRQSRCGFRHRRNACLDHPPRRAWHPWRQLGKMVRPHWHGRRTSRPDHHRALVELSLDGRRSFWARRIPWRQHRMTQWPRLQRRR